MLDVYKARYKFKGNPFRLSPDPGFSFDHQSYVNAKAYLKYGIAQGEGFVAIIGSPGTGKTTLINQLLAELDATRVTGATLSTAQLDSGNLLNLLAHAFGLHVEAGSEVSPVLQFEAFLKRQSQRGRRTVLIVDEAQGLSPNLLEELRLLSNFQVDNQLLLQVFLVGQGQLLTLLHAPAMEQLRQRLIAAAHLEPLDLDQTISYIECRLLHVGWKGDPAFGEGALRLIHKVSGGVPRQINLICHRLFLSGGLQGKQEFGDEDARRVIDELQKEGLLGADVPDHSVDEDVAVQPKDAETPVRHLPRPGAGGEPSSLSASRRNSGGHRARPAGNNEPGDEASPKSAAQVRQEQRDKSAAHVNARADVSTGEEELSALADKRDTDKSLRTKIIGLLDKVWPGRWRWAALGGLAASVALVAVMDTQIDRQAETSRNAFSTVSGAVEFDTAPKEKGDTLVERTPMTNSADPAPGMDSPTGGITQRDSATVGMIPGPESQAMTRPDQQEPLDRDTGDVEEPGELTSVGEGKDLSPSAGLDAAVAAPLQADEAAKGVALAGPPHTVSVPLERDESQLEASTAVDQSAVAEPVEGRSGHAQSGAEKAPDELRSVPPRGEAAEQSAEASAANEMANAPRSAMAGKEATKANSLVPAEPGGTQVASDAKSNASDKAGTTEKESVRAKSSTASREDEHRPAHPSPAPVIQAAVKPASPEEKPAAANMIAQVSRQEIDRSLTTLNKHEALLLDSKWYSEGKPALLLPSELTTCKPEGNQLSCRSVPQSATTRRGKAQYKVEATLQSFTAGGAFLLSYRTLVKLSGENTPSGQETIPDDGGWQATEHAMECELIGQTKITCQDENGSMREYRRSGSTERE